MIKSFYEAVNYTRSPQESFTAKHVVSSQHKRDSHE